MDLSTQDLPATLQAFELQDNREIFLAEQVVSSQSDIDQFTSRYTGKLIKAKKTVVKRDSSSVNNTVQKRNSGMGALAIVITLLLVALVIYGFYTGWIQQKLNIKP